MATNKQVCDLQAGKGFSAGQSREHLRNYRVTDPDMKKFGYFDPTREHLNFEVGKGGVVTPVRKDYSIAQRFADNLKERGIEDPNAIKKRKGMEPNRNTVANIILGGSREAMRSIAFGSQQVDFFKGADNSTVTRSADIERWAVEMYQLMARKYKEENIVAFVVHLDEKNPHIHCTIVPVNDKNKISYNEMFGGNIEQARKKFLQLHDDIAEVNQKWNLERGDDINLTGARHVDTEEYHRNLVIQNQSLKKEIEENVRNIDEQNTNIRRAAIRLKGLQSMINNLENQRADIESAINDLNNQLHDGTITQEQMTAQMQKLLQQKEEVERKLADKEEKLKTATEQLNALADKRAKANKEYMEVRQNINKELPRLQDKVLHDMSATAWNILHSSVSRFAEEARDFADSLTVEQRSSFENIFKDSGLESMAKAGNEIIAVSTALFLGYIDQATNYAVSHGGGGSSPGGGWGRDKDDDDERWRFKCLAMAARMMRPAGQRIKKKK